MTLKEVTLGYLCVLNDSAVNAELTQTERNIGYQNIMGCLHTLVSYLESNPSSEHNFVADTIKLREKVNGYKPVGDPELVAHTHGCAMQVYQFYKGLP